MTTIHVLSPIAHHRHPQADRSLKDLIRQMSHLEWKLWEVTGRSEVTRARNHVASAAYSEVKEGDLVFWLDADIVIRPLTFALHMMMVEETSLAISGRYVRRQDPSRIAASWDDQDERLGFSRALTSGQTTFYPIMCGMGALLMTAKKFFQQADASPEGLTKMRNGREVREKIVCSNPIIPTKEGHYAMLSEDFDYCSRIPGGVWIPQFFVEGMPCSLDYGHVVEQVVFSSGPVSFKDDR